MGLAVFHSRFPFLSYPSSLPTAEEREVAKGYQDEIQLRSQRPKQESKTYKCPHYPSI